MKFKNYTKRVKNFIIDMINPETQIIINNEENSKKEIYQKRNKRNFIQKKPLIFKGYIDETERIREHIKNNQYLNSIYDTNGESIFKDNENEKSKINLVKNILNRNKNELYSIDNQQSSFNKPINLSQDNSSSLILRHLLSKKINNKNNIDKYKNSKILNIKALYINKFRKNFSDNIINKKIINDLENNLSINNKGQKKLNKIINQSYSRTIKEQNSDKNKLIKSYHNKLHFKAAEEIAENELDKRNKFKLLPKLFPKKKSKDKCSYNSDEEEEESFNSFYYQNPFKKCKKRIIYNPILMEELSKIAFKKNNNTDKFNISPLSSSEINKNEIINQTYDKKLIKKMNIKDENEIEIDGEIFEKTQQFHLITKKILKKCNVYSNKNINNRNKLKVGNGKNMMTKGLSIKDFFNKYKLK